MYNYKLLCDVVLGGGICEARGCDFKFHFPAIALVLNELKNNLNLTPCGCLVGSLLLLIFFIFLILFFVFTRNCVVTARSKTSIDEPPSSLPIWLCRFKIQQWWGFWTGRDVLVCSSFQPTKIHYKPLVTTTTNKHDKAPRSQQSWDATGSRWSAEDCHEEMHSWRMSSW